MLNLKWILLFGMVGTTAELLLLEHMEDYWQWTPLVILVLGGAVQVWNLYAPGLTSARGMQIIALLFIAAGIAGIILHYQGNAEFELEMYPDISSWKLFQESMQGATPALAPGSMVLLGLLALFSAHPETRPTQE